MAKQASVTQLSAAGSGRERSRLELRRSGEVGRGRSGAVGMRSSLDVWAGVAMTRWRGTDAQLRGGGVRRGRGAFRLAALAQRPGAGDVRRGGVSSRCARSTTGTRDGV